MKRGVLGTFLTLLSIVAGGVGLAFYVTNTNTTYFSGLGRNTVVIGTVAAAIVALLLWCLFGGATTSIKDLLPIAAPALFMVGFLTLLNSRVNGIAAIMTFENNEQNMADLNSALIALGALAIAAVLACLAAFCDVKKKAE
ncbi:MAG: hypothetical protein IIZ39_13165 [Blautia sp.]|nr:hypothetical protein [Blautia sp.]